MAAEPDRNTIDVDIPEHRAGSCPALIGESDVDHRSAPDTPPDHGHQRPEGAILPQLATGNSTAAELFAAGRYKQAVPIFEQVLAGCRTELGPTHQLTLTVAGNLGVAQVAAGQRRPGIATIAANLADRVRVLGDDDPATLTARDALATAYRVVGDVDDAVELSRQVTAQRAHRLGPTDPETLTSRMGLIRAVAAAGDLSSAVALFTSALQDTEQAYGPHHGRTRALLECGRSSGVIHRTG
jgi:Flp pilus assembly protein TadD